MAVGAVSLRKSHEIVILSFCNIVKGQAKYIDLNLNLIWDHDPVSSQIPIYSKAIHC